MKEKLTYIIVLLSLSLSADPVDTTHAVQGVCINTEIKAVVLSDYCEGFRHGWGDGFCYQDQYCISPPSPPCPVRRVNEDDSYKAGYGRGFYEGRKHKENQ